MTPACLPSRWARVDFPRRSHRRLPPSAHLLLCSTNGCYALLSRAVAALTSACVSRQRARADFARDAVAADPQPGAHLLLRATNAPYALRSRAATAFTPA